MESETLGGSDRTILSVGRTDGRQDVRGVTGESGLKNLEVSTSHVTDRLGLFLTAVATGNWPCASLLQRKDLTFFKKGRSLDAESADFPFDLCFKPRLHMVGVDRKIGTSQLLKLFEK